MEGLLTTYIKLLSLWNKNFYQKRVFIRAIALALSFILTLGRKTITRALCAAGLDQVDWTSTYRFFSRRLWSPSVLFDPILTKTTEILRDEAFIAVAYDDTLVRKTGRRIKGSSWQRDPLSPHFKINLVWGMRYLQASLLVPLYKQEKTTPPRALPVQFEQLPKFKKPSRKGTKEDWEEYRTLVKEHNTSTTFVRELRFLRNRLDREGLYNKPILAVCDGSFCNKTCFNAGVPRTFIIARARKNARLYTRTTGKSKVQFYDKTTFTPDDIRRSESHSYRATELFYGGAFRKIQFKELQSIYWKHGTGRKPLRLIVIAPAPYRRNSKESLRYRDPAYLLTTDLETPAEILIQKYFDRWQIEVNFREEKDLMGLGQQQVWSARSIPRLPAFIAACYSLLLLSSILRFKDQRDPNVFVEKPKWRRYEEQRRPSCIDLMALIRKEVLETANWPPEMPFKPNETNIILKAAA